jgi:hypothetical protein
MTLFSQPVVGFKGERARPPLAISQALIEALSCC